MPTPSLLCFHLSHIHTRIWIGETFGCKIRICIVILIAYRIHSDPLILHAHKQMTVVQVVTKLMKKHHHLVRIVDHIPILVPFDPTACDLLKCAVFCPQRIDIKRIFPVSITVFQIHLQQVRIKDCLLCFAPSGQIRIQKIMSDTILFILNYSIQIYIFYTLEYIPLNIWVALF